MTSTERNREGFSSATCLKAESARRASLIKEVGIDPAH